MCTINLRVHAAGNRNAGYRRKRRINNKLSKNKRGITKNRRLSTLPSIQLLIRNKYNIIIIYKIVYNNRNITGDDGEK